jgi:hypothetical protein
MNRSDRQTPGGYAAEGSWAAAGLSVNAASSSGPASWPLETPMMDNRAEEIEAQPDQYDRLLTSIGRLCEQDHRIAYHELGHYIVNRVTGTDSISFISITPSERHEVSVAAPTVRLSSKPALLALIASMRPTFAKSSRRRCRRQVKTGATKATSMPRCSTRSSS